LIRHQLLKDKQRAVEACWFPSARKATSEEEHTFRACGRVGRVFAQGVWLLLAEEVAAREAYKRLPGRPAKWEAYYQGQPWFREERSPGEEARLGVCAGEERCAAVLLSEHMQRWYEQCVPVEVVIQGTWEVLDPAAYTSLLAQAYQEVRYGRLAALLEPFHDGHGLVRCLEVMETSRVGRRRQRRAAHLHSVQGELLVQSS
jgi:hypothetical protein